MRKRPEIQHLLLLHRQTASQPRYLSALLERFGSAQAVHREARPSIAHEIDVPLPLLLSVCQSPTPEAERALENDLKWLANKAHHLITRESKDYPQILLETADAPHLLFGVGDPGLLNSRQLAIVGSRNTTSSGRRIAGMFAEALSMAGLTITSGLAIGVDAAAHEGALRQGGKTIAVLGSGIDVIYPRRNRGLASRVRDSGLIVSEFPLGTSGRAENFPRRNRIVTGMSVGTLVVEAALRSGSLISARLAAEQGRDVFAVPGSIFSEQSRGCHQLIREGARLTESVTDILEEIGGFVLAKASGPAPIPDLPEPQGELLRLLGDSPTSIDDLVNRSGRKASLVISSMVELELAGLVESGTGGFVRVPHWS